MKRELIELPLRFTSNAEGFWTLEKKCYTFSWELYHL